MKSLWSTLVLFIGIFAITANAEISNIQEIKSPIVLKVGTMGTYNPFSFVDEDDNITGYDIEVLKAISQQDPSLQFEFIASPWDTLFPGLDADRFQLLANQISKTPERLKRYQFSQYPYFNSVSVFIVNSTRDDLRTTQDLKGEKIGLTIGDAHTLDAENWNNKNGEILDIIYYEGDLPIILQDVENGRIAGTVNDPIVAADKAKIQGLNIKVIDDQINKKPTFFIYKQDKAGQEYQQRIDKALKQLIDNGTLSKLSMKWFGADYSN